MRVIVVRKAQAADAVPPISGKRPKKELQMF